MCTVSCPDDWYADNNTCYYVSIQKKKHDAAREICTDSDGDLVSFTDEREKNFVLSKSEYEFVQLFISVHV